MRKARAIASGDGYYHVVNRISGRRMLLSPHWKGRLLHHARAAAKMYQQTRASAKMTDTEKAMFLDLLAERGIVEGSTPSSSDVANERALTEANRRAEEAEAKRKNEVAEARRQADEWKRQVDELKQQVTDSMRQADEAKRQAREAERQRQTEVQTLKRQLDEANRKTKEADVMWRIRNSGCIMPSIWW